MKFNYKKIFLYLEAIFAYSEHHFNHVLNSLINLRLMQYCPQSFKYSCRWHAISNNTSHIKLRTGNSHAQISYIHLITLLVMTKASLSCTLCTMCDTTLSENSGLSTWNWWMTVDLVTMIACTVIILQITPNCPSCRVLTMTLIPSALEVLCRDVNETLAYETETFVFWSETRPRPRPSCNSTRPRRLIFATRRDRDLARLRPKRFSRPSTFSIVPKQWMANLPLLMSQTDQSLQLQLQCSLSWNLFTT